MKKIVLILLLVLSLFSFVSAQEDDLPIGYIEIPSISLYRPIYFIPLVDKQYNLDDLGYGLGKVGHLDQTTWIHDNWGRVVLVGHNPGAFADLPYVSIGASIFIWDNSSGIEYIVTDTHIIEDYDIFSEESERYWLGPTDTPFLLLMTCINMNNYDGTIQRYLVEAIPNNQTQP